MLQEDYSFLSEHIQRKLKSGECSREYSELLFNYMKVKTVGYGFHLWQEDSPWQANAIKLLEDIRYGT